MEFAGDGAHNLSIDERIVLCNLTVEAGAKAGIVEPDEKVVEYCKAHGREAVHMFKSDDDAQFAAVYDYDLSKIEPVVVRPDFVDNFALLKDVKKKKSPSMKLSSVPATTAVSRTCGPLPMW